MTILPSRQLARIAPLKIADEEIDSASAPLSVSVALEQEIDIVRGDLADPTHPPASTTRIAATLLWMSADPLDINRPYLLKHTTRYVFASVVRLVTVLDPPTLSSRPADHLAMNEFGEVEIECHHPLYCDPYSDNRATGAFILVDPIRNGTLAAGMIRAGDAVSIPSRPPAAHGLTVWFNGLSSAGKTTISRAVHEKLWAMGYKVELLDGDIVRQHLSKDLGFSKEDRDENIRRIGFMAEMLTRNGVIVLVSAISPYRAVRNEIRARIGSFLEVYVNAPLDVCEQRDLKGIYRRARAGERKMVTGVDDPYEPPAAPEIECHTGRETLAESTAKVSARLTNGSPATTEVTELSPHPPRLYF